MTPLQESVKHWEENLEKLIDESIEAEDIYSINCPLCTAYVEPTDDCSKCPVAKDTGNDLCEGSPWAGAQRWLNTWFYQKQQASSLNTTVDAKHKEKAIAAFQAEIDYLKQLAEKEAG